MLLQHVEQCRLHPTTDACRRAITQRSTLTRFSLFSNTRLTMKTCSERHSERREHQDSRLPQLCRTISISANNYCFSRVEIPCGTGSGINHSESLFLRNYERNSSKACAALRAQASEHQRTRENNFREWRGGRLRGAGRDALKLRS